MSSRASAALALCVMAAAGYGVVAAWSWPEKTRLFPLVIAIPLFCLAVAELVWSLARSSEQRGDVRDFQFAHGLPQDEARKRTALAAAWIVGFFAAVVLLGFPLAVPLFVFLYLKLEARESWALCAVFAAVVSAVFYGLFDRMLHLPFPQGWLLQWSGPS
jgi:hypothetical protein